MRCINESVSRDKDKFNNEIEALEERYKIDSEWFSSQAQEMEMKLLHEISEKTRLNEKLMRKKATEM